MVAEEWAGGVDVGAGLSAYGELLRDGACGPETVGVLRRLAAQVVRTSSFPPPDDHDRWSDEAVDDLLADMFARTKGPAFVIECFVKATDDASLERLLLAAVRNHLIDQAKGTDRGKLRRRLVTLLSADSRFERVRASGGLDGWGLAGRGRGRWQGDIEDLHDAAAAVRGVTITRWNEAGPTPRETAGALVSVAYAVLVVAGGVVRDEDLARVVQTRFGLLRPPTVVSLVFDEPWAEPAAPAEDGPEAMAVADARAEEIWQSLSMTERSLLPHLGKSAAELAAVLEAGPKAARRIADALAEKLRVATMSDEQLDNVIGFLQQRCVTRP